jgi:2-oxoglutarate ferredoxin oxidoreductase subunit gamma
VFCIVRLGPYSSAFERQLTMSRSEIRIAGAGGQGVVTAGRILAEAAILCGRASTHSQVYGPQARGGASRSDVVIATEAIGFPLADDIDLLVILSSEAFSRYKPELREHGRLIVDGDCARECLNGRGYDGDIGQYPVVEKARSISGGQLVAGVVALGVLQSLAEVVDAEALRQAVAAGVPARHKELNLKALEAGMQLVGRSGR